MKDMYQWQQKNDFPFAQKHRPAKGTVGQNHITHSIYSFTEFDPIKSVIVGYIDDTARVSQEFSYPKDVFDSVKVGPFPRQYIEVGQKNQNTLAEEFQKMGIEVVRVGQFDFSQKYLICGVETPGFSAFSPRDFPFIYHDSLYQFPMTYVGYLNIPKSFEWIQKQLHKNKSKIYSTWAPKSQGFRYQNSPQPLSKKIFQRQDQYFADAANLLKVGLDILFSLSISGSRGCFLKFRQLMQKRYKGIVRVHLLDFAENYDNFHIDTTFSFVGWNKKIQKFIAIVNGDKTKPTTIPAILRGKNWALIELSKFDKQFQDPDYQYVSEAIGMNFLTLNPELLVISDKQSKLKEIMEFYGVKCLQLENKHSIQLGGGFHCVTNEINREDTYNFGQILQKDPKELTLKERAGLFDQSLLQFLQSKGPIDEWVRILNENNIFPEYLHSHLTAEEKQQMQQKHAKVIQDFREKINKDQNI